MPAPSTSARSISRSPATPSSSTRHASTSASSAATTRSTMPPGASAQCTALLRIACANVSAHCTVSADVSSPSTTSTSRLPANQRKPTTLSGRSVISPISVIESAAAGRRQHRAARRRRVELREHLVRVLQGRRAFRLDHEVGLAQPRPLTARHHAAPDRARDLLAELAGPHHRRFEDEHAADASGRRPARRRSAGASAGATPRACAATTSAARAASCPSARPRPRR